MDYSFLIVPINPIFTLLTPVQLISMVGLILSLVYAHLCMRAYPNIKWLIVSPLTYIVNAIAFYIFLIYANLSNTVNNYILILNGWSSGLRLHLIVLMMAGFIFLYYRGKKWMSRH